MFAFEDDYSFGVFNQTPTGNGLSPSARKLTERFRYTPESVFDTFPWPQTPTAEAD